MESEQNDNKDYVVVYDLCDTAGKVLKKCKKNSIPNDCIINEEQAKKKFDYEKSNATEVNYKEPEYYYINLYNKKLFAKVPSNKCSYDTYNNNGFTVETDKPMGFGMNFSYYLKTGKDLVKNSKNIDGILLHVGGSIPQLFFNKEEERFSYYPGMSVYNGLEYQISLEKFLSDNNQSFNLFRSSYWKNLFNSDVRNDQTGSFARLFGVANDGNNRCGVGCFSCGKVIVDDNYIVNNDYEYLAKYKPKLSLNDVSQRIGINSEQK